MLLILIVFVGILQAENKICGLTPEQIEMAKKIYSQSKQYISKYNNMNFRNTLIAIYIIETSLGKDNIIGDRYTRTGKLKNITESSLGPGQIKLLTVLTLFKKVPKLQKKYKYLYHKDITALKKYNKYMNKAKYFKMIINSKKWQEKWKEGKKLKVKKWVYNEYNWSMKKLEKYKLDMLKDNNIMNLLLTDLSFSIEISNNWLIFNYEQAIKKHMPHPYLRAISAYNGGWYNYKYIKKVLNALNYVKCLKKKGILKN